MPKSDATPNAVAVGARGIVLAPQPMAGNRAMRVEMRNSSPPSLWLTTGAGRRRLDDRTYGRRRPPAPNNMMLHRGSGGLGLTLCPFLVPCTKCIQNVNVNALLLILLDDSRVAGGAAEPPTAVHSHCDNVVFSTMESKMSET